MGEWASGRVGERESGREIPLLGGVSLATGWVPLIPLWGGFTRIFYEGSWYFIRGFLLTNN